MKYKRDPKVVERENNILADRDKGMTYELIAEKYGVSKQQIHQICGKRNPAMFQFFDEQRCIYKPIRDWLNAEKISTAELVRMSGLQPVSQTIIRWRKLLNGMYEFRKRDIEILIKVTGMTYEEMFK